MDNLIEIYQDTVSIVIGGSYMLNGKTHIIDNDMVTKSYWRARERKYYNVNQYNTVIHVENIDCIDMAQKLSVNGTKVALLNMASLHTPGGGVEKGSRAQEETLFRRSNLFKALYPFHKKLAVQYGLKPSQSHYPMHYCYGGIYTPDVTFFKDHNYNLMDNPFTCNVISVAALNVRRDTKYMENGHLTEEGRRITKNKIETIFDLAIKNNIETLVLGAFGCGAFANNPEDIAQLFNDILFSMNYRGAFKEVVFAIIEDKNSNGRNFNIFNKIIKK